MLIIRRASNTNPLQAVFPILCLAVAAIFCWVVSHATAAAQIRDGEAQVRSMKGVVTFYGSAQGRLTAFTLRPGHILQPGNVIETGNGRVVIALGDGSQVTIFPGSRVELKDFRAGGSWRDLLHVMVGQVRATINHYGKRPNPYRVYSPIASIAVRGTDFLVTVEPSAETRVDVYEGLVEVSSLVKPQQSVLVRPGRNIIVRSDGDISLVTAAPRGELNEIKSLRVGNSLDSNLYTAFSSHQENFTDLRPSRFTAFNDSHLDSLQNPAYAGELRQSNGRFYLLPSFSPEIETLYRYDRETSEERPRSISSSNYTLSSQLSFFTPISSRMVVGGGVAVTKTDLGGSQTDEPYTTQNLRAALAYSQRRGLLLPPDPPDARHLPEDGGAFLHLAGKAKFTTADMALMIARRLGQTERTSVGVKFDYQEDRSSFSLDSNWSTKVDYRQEKSLMPSRRIGFTAGLTHNFGGDKKFGVYYRYNTGAFQSQFYRKQHFKTIELKSFFTGSSEFDFSESRSRRLSEVGARFRGSVTRRLFYGLESSFLDEYRRSKYRHVLILNTGEAGYTTMHTRTKSAMLGAGLGYALRRRTVLGVDLSAGGALEDFRSERQEPPGIQSSDGFHDKRSAFWSLHFGGQTDLWWKLFVSGSRLILREGSSTHSWAIFDGETFYDDRFYIRENSKLSNLSLGWRMTPSWIVQYTYFTSHGPNAPSHTLMFRYEFGGKNREIIE